MDTKEEFYKVIYGYYEAIAFGKIDTEYLTELSNRITDYYYEQYQRFGSQYPKSIKRYSTFKIEDLDHSFTHDIVIKFFKEKMGVNYARFSKIILQMNDFEFQEFEKRRYEYHTK